MKLDLNNAAGLTAMCEVARLKSLERGLRRRWRKFAVAGVVWLLAGAVGVLSGHAPMVLAAMVAVPLCIKTTIKIAKAMDNIWEGSDE